MNREDYIRRLRRYLAALPEEEIEEAVNYVDEYFTEAGDENFEQALNDLGTPQKFAAQIRADYAIKQNDQKNEMPQSKQASKSGIRSGWMIFLGILSLPISVPLTMVVLLLILCGVIIVSIPVFLLGFIVVTFIGVSIFMIRMAFLAVTTSLASTLLLIAATMVLLAVTCLSLAGLLAFVGKLIPWISIKLGEVFTRLRRNEK